MALGLHVDAPIVPVFDPVKGLLKKCDGQGRIGKAADLAVFELPEDGRHVLTMHFRDVA
ncbi:MAG: hypothetical protein JRJ85_13920, partial [Deltaproteobacteria bacterium]|nr:hypothetical protein [Deltaproteobacteria bacterium]